MKLFLKLFNKDTYDIRKKLIKVYQTKEKSIQANTQTISSC